jgi:nondiscriminating glutamyl-tRNA synthetase
MANQAVRVRFAPSPTGLMHLGNVRTALFNYLFAKQQEGTFVLRIEDTDPERNFDPGANQIQADLKWLGIHWQEGPGVGGPHEPYFQSERISQYKECLEKLRDMGRVYPCFCTSEELDVKRQRQKALKRPPRYDRTCYRLSKDVAQEKAAAGTPHIYRFAIDHTVQIVIKDLVKGSITFDMKNFSDFPISRTNGSFTFMFANCVDDITMKTTHTFRGQDHLSNTAGQASIYQALNIKLPTFWHMPILCNREGKKLSKRDFGFSLKDLRNEGYLPEAINNYLGIVGGSFEQEILDLDSLAKAINFEHRHGASQVKYDVEKLRWVNRQWIANYDDAKLAALCRPFLEHAYPQAVQLNDDRLVRLITSVKTDLTTLADVVDALAFVFGAPEDARTKLVNELGADIASRFAQAAKQSLTDENVLATLKASGKQLELKPRELFAGLRIALTGQPRGLSINDLVADLGMDEVKQRLSKII